jgi:2-aminoethylphosphonate-pyruvate transaminase
LRAGGTRQRCGVDEDLILLNPGPACTSTRVKDALLRGDLCHREPEFGEVLARIRGEGDGFAHSRGHGRCGGKRRGAVLGGFRYRGPFSHSQLS